MRSSELSLKFESMAQELHYLDLTEIARRIRTREISSAEATQEMIDRIAQIDRQLKSYAVVTADVALAQARQADKELERGIHRGPLHGVPVAVKDLCSTRGIPTAAGMPIYKNYLPEIDATVVAKLKEAGAVLLGKLQMTEGAFSIHHPSITPPVNPWSAAHWSGVSSSGSGVATAAGLCYGSLGSDTLGSIRFPSTMNGVTGLKPTWGRVSRAGVFAFAESMDNIGPMTRSVVDSAAMLSVIAGADPNDPTAAQIPVPDYLAQIDQGIDGVRVGIDRKAIAVGADAEMTRVTEEAAAVLARLGAHVREVTLPPLDEVVPDAVLLCATEAAVSHEKTFPERAAEYGPVLARFLETGRGTDAATLVKILRRRAAFSGQIAALFGGIDLLLLPAMNEAAPTVAALGQRAADPQARQARVRFTTPFNMSGNPCLTLPGGATSDGLPLGFQIIGRHFEEVLVLRAGHAFQRATDWHQRHPRV